MSTPTAQPPGLVWQAPQTQTQTPPMAPNAGENEDGVSVRPMRLKVLYTFDDQNKTNCLARWPHVLQIQTVAMDERTSIGVIELKTCIDAIVQCSPELVARLGQDYTVYAYDYSEYDNPLVGQGMLSRALSSASPTPDAPANQSRQLITGRVCKNILGIFTNGVKETLEVKLRLVPVPTMLRGEYVNTMEKYREMNKNVPTGYDTNEWNAFMQLNPNLGQVANKVSPAPALNAMNNNLRDGMSMEVMNQLLSPHLQQPPMQDPFNPANQISQASYNSQTSFNQNMNAENSGNESRGTTAAAEKAKKTSRPSSRVSVKRPRARKPKAIVATAGGNTSGYEEGTDGDDGPSNKKRAKVTKTDWNGNATLGMLPESLRVAAGTSGSLRLLRPIAAYPASGGPEANHLQDAPRAPTPVPHLPNQHVPRDQAPPQGSLRRGSFSQLPQLPPKHVSPYPPSQKPEDQVRNSIESANPSPERNFSPVDTAPEIGSSPPVMRSRPPSIIRSSPSCPSSPVLPQMPRTDSGFMSGSLEELFGEDEDTMEPNNENNDLVPHQQFGKQVTVRKGQSPEDSDWDFVIQEIPGPPELLPSRMPIIDLPTQVEARARAAINRAGSVMSEDGQVLPPLKNSNRPSLRKTMSQSDIRPSQYKPQKSSLGPKSPQTNPSQPEEQSQHHPHSQPPSEIRQPSHSRQPSQSRMSQALVDAPSPALNNPPPNVPTGIPAPTPSFSQPVAQAPAPAPMQDTVPLPVAAPAPVTQSRPTSRSGMKVRTASMGSLTLPQIPASDPILPPSSLQRSQTWSEAPPDPAFEVPVQYVQIPPQWQTTQQMPLGMNYQPGPPYNKTVNAKKASIQQKLEFAIANGQMPPFCANCGAINTPTWRKAWSQDLQTTPGYYEYSDEPGAVTAVIVLTRDAEGKPTSHKLIKKFLGPQEDQRDYDEFLLCNPCGIWMSKYKSQRPEDKWDTNGLQERSRGDKKRTTQRLSRPRKPPGSNLMMPTSDANFPQSDTNFPPSDANFPISEANFPISEVPGPSEGVSPGDTTQNQLAAAPIEGIQRQRSTSAQPKKRLNAMTSDAASAALRRAIQSSPARWAGTQHSPIELEEPDMGSTRRLLFPSPRKDASPKALGEVAVNVVQVATEFRSPKESMMEIESQDKENHPPAIEDDDIDAEFLQLFEEEISKGAEIQRPSTPVRNSPPHNPFKTPTRPTPSHRPITRSVTRSARSARSNRSAKSPSQLLTFAQTPTRTPGSIARRLLSPRHDNGVFESPFTATLNQMMSEANNQTSPIRNDDVIELDFGNLPELPQLGYGHNHDTNFSLEDFFSTDVPMPSSPPRMSNYQIYEDPVTSMQNVNNLDWSDFGKFAAERVAADEEMVIKDEPLPSPTKLPAKKKPVEEKEAE